MKQTCGWIARLAFVVAAVCVAAQGATAQAYPNRPVRIILALPPGGAPDIVARVISHRLTEQLRQPFIVDSRPGGSGVIAAELVKKAQPDGYTVLLAGTTVFATLPELKRNLPYDPNKDFIALTRVASVAHVVAVNPSLGVSSVADFVKLAKSRPGQFNYGSSGNGSSSHLATEMLNVLGGLKTVHIPYKGTVLALNEVISGQLQFILMNPLVVMPHAKAGKVKVIATTGATRDPLLPELPPVSDVIPGFESTLWWGMALPMNTSRLVVTKLWDELTKALQSSEVHTLLATQGATVHSEPPAQFAAFIQAERARIAAVGRQVNIDLE